MQVANTSHPSSPLPPSPINATKAVGSVDLFFLTKRVRFFNALTFTFSCCHKNRTSTITKQRVCKALTKLKPKQTTMKFTVLLAFLLALMPYLFMAAEYATEYPIDGQVGDQYVSPDQGDDEVPASGEDQDNNGDEESPIEYEAITEPPTVDEDSTEQPTVSTFAPTRRPSRSPTDMSERPDVTSFPTRSPTRPYGKTGCDKIATVDECAARGGECEWYVMNPCNYLIKPVTCSEYKYGCQERRKFCEFTQGTDLDKQMQCNFKNYPCYWDRTKKVCVNVGPTN